ncbi:MAG: FAD-dependent oxidoreductase [Micromonosporaceae bacterium]|nr:FAD-dependent oxidoreductase [Micromonosporaceae bacterium]
MSVAVVGGGLAGITAALALADAGRDVSLYEGRGWLGGLTHSYRHGEIEVDNGQHVFLRCCEAYRRLLARLGVTDRVALQPRLSIPVRSAATGRTARLRRAPLPAPAHLAGSLLRYSPLRPGQRLRFIQAALALRRVDPSDPATDEQSFGDWLSAHGQSPRAVSALWDLIGVATLNAPAPHASLALAATVFQIGLLTKASAGDIGWSLVPLRRLHGEPALQHLSAAGARVYTGARVESVRPRGDRWTIGVRGDEHVVDQVVLAVPPAAAQRLLPAGLPFPPGWAEQLGSSPIINAHVVYDRPVLDGPFLATVESPAQWIFDRTAQAGEAVPAGGQYIAVSLSAADDLVDLPTAQLREMLVPELAKLLPAARGAGVLDFFVTRERHATIRQGPGSGRLRPPPGAVAPGLAIAGAWTATGWPATMEGAVRSGEAAAAAVLSTVEHVPAEVAR